jgi:hypothetical protein
VAVISVTLVIHDGTMGLTQILAEGCEPLHIICRLNRHSREFEIKSPDTELSEEELKKVAGGTPAATAKPKAPVEYMEVKMTNVLISG